MHFGCDYSCSDRQQYILPSFVAVYGWDYLKKLARSKPHEIVFGKPKMPRSIMTEMK